jgi:hypothetical protein
MRAWQEAGIVTKDAGRIAFCNSAGPRRIGGQE